MNTLSMVKVTGGVLMHLHDEYSNVLETGVCQFNQWDIGHLAVKLIMLNEVPPAQPTDKLSSLEEGRAWLKAMSHDPVNMPLDGAD